MKLGVITFLAAGALALPALAGNHHARTTTDRAPRAAEQPAPAAKTGMLRISPLQPGAWVPFTSAEGRFYIEMPGVPRQQAQTLNTAVGAIQMYTFMHEFDGGNRAYMVSYNDYPAAIVRRGNAQRMLDGARNGAVANVHGTLIRETRISMNGNPGRELLISVPAQNAVVRARLYLVGARLYQALAIGRASNTNPADDMHYLNSFRLLP